MSDVAEVKEAIEWYENDRPRSLNHWASLDLMADAARRWVRMVETGEQVKWCLEHGASSSDDSNEAWCETAIFEDWAHSERNGPKPKPCRIVSRLIVDEGGLDETQ